MVESRSEEGYAAVLDLFLPQDNKVTVEGAGNKWFRLQNKREAKHTVANNKVYISCMIV